MKSLRLFLALLSASFLFLLPSSASGQASIYGTVAVTNYGYAFNNGAFTYSGDRVGFAGGAFYNFPIQSRLTAGIDAHGSFTPGASGGGKAFVSARFGFVPRSNPFRPYLQIGGGLVHVKVPALTNIVGAQTLNKGALDLALGLDLRLTHSLDYRVLEFEGAGGGSSAMAVGSGSISTGLVYHFPSVRP